MRALVRRYRLAAVIAVALGACSLLPLLLAPPPIQFTPKHFRQIQRGMTLQEVKEILGSPPGDYTTGDAEAAFPITISSIGSVSKVEVWQSNADPGMMFSNSMYSGRWIGRTDPTINGVAITVFFDSDGRVIHSRAMPVQVTKPSLMERVRRWINAASATFLK